MTTVSYAGKNIKWNTIEDAKGIKEEILSTKDLNTLVLEGNTLGIEAAKEIGIALEKQPTFERAHWKDLFTGRLKNEIPQALKHLFSGVNISGAKLKELDLSDNALGPLGVEGITDFLKSTSCHSLEELRLNNNGLGIKGGTMLAESLLELSINAKAAGSPLKMKVFIAGRNRLENEGAKKFAEVFSEIKTLEEVVMPQNGIFHEGIAALARALSSNQNLRIINLNDNTFTHKGARAMSNYLPAMVNLEVINFGDCLLKTEGALSIASSLENQTKLRVLHLDSNEIKIGGALAIIDAIVDKKNFESLQIDANQFGEEGCMEIKRVLSEYDKLSILGPLEDDEEPESDEESEEGEDAYEEDDVQEVTKDEQNKIEPIKCSVEEFIENPSASRLLGLPVPVPDTLVSEAKRRSLSLILKDTSANHTFGADEAFINECIFIFMTTASLMTCNNAEVKRITEESVRELAKNAFECAKASQLETLVTNSFLVHLGLLKSETKNFIIRWDIRGALMALSYIVKGNEFPRESKNTFQFFFSRPQFSIDEYSKEKHEVMKALYAS